MRESLAFFVTSLFVAAVVTPAVRWLARRTGAVDAPGGRRVHRDFIPRLGGLAIIAGFFASIGAMSYAGLLENELQAGDRWIAGLIMGSVIIGAVGLVDDVRGMSASTKLLFQVLAATLAFAFDYRIQRVALPFLGTIDVGLLSLPITVLWIVGIVNALNLIDGLDGLAAGVALCAAITTFTVAAVHENLLAMAMSAALGGAVLGFLLYNFNPATIFMGDVGSMFIGFSLATTSLLGAKMKSTTAVAILVPIIALGLPIVDTLFAIVRRFLERRSLFSADRGHIHHRMLEIGLTHRRAVLVLYGVSVALAASAIIVSFGHVWEVGAALLVVSGVLFGVIRSVGLFETQWLRRRRDLSPTLVALRRAFPSTIHALVDGTMTQEEALALLGRSTEHAIRFTIESAVPARSRVGADVVSAEVRGPQDSGSWLVATPARRTDNPQELHLLVELLADALSEMPGSRARRVPASAQDVPDERRGDTALGELADSRDRHSA